MSNRAMQQNPAYGWPSLPEQVYEEVLSSQTVTISQNVSTCDDPGAQAYVTSTSVKNDYEPKTKRWVAVIAVVVCVSLLVLSLVAVIVLASNFHSEIVKLQNRIRQFEDQLSNQTCVTNQTDLVQLTNLQSSVDTATTQLSSLQSSVDTLTTARNTTMTHLSSLQSSVNTLTTARDTTMTHLSSLQSSVDTLTTAIDINTTQLSSLQSSVNTLTTRINSPVNLYQNCIEETRVCTMLNLQDSWRGCSTPSIQVNFMLTGLYTIDMRCEYDSFTGQLESSILRRSGSLAWCQCDLILPVSTGLGTVQTEMGTCSLFVTTCPPITIP